MTAEDSTRRSRNLILGAFALVLALLPLCAHVAPLQDQMDWVLQAKILSDPANTAFAEHYRVEWRPVPNLLGTVLIAAASKVLPIFTAAGVVYALYLIWFVIAYVYFIRAGSTPRPLLELIGVLYALNHFFLMGFYNFVLGLSLALFALGYLRRNVANATVKTWAVFSLLALLTYLSHFLPFGILCLGLAIVLVQTYGRQWQKYAAPVSSLIPALLCLTWYTQHRAAEFWFHYAFHNPLYYTWYKIGPLAIASNYYPLTPTWAAWINVLINAIAIAAIFGLIVFALWKQQIDFRSPWAIIAAALFIAGLLTPTRIYELLRPGQRLIFAAVLLLAAAIKAHKPVSQRQYRLAAVALALLVCWNGIWWFDATRKTEAALQVVSEKVGADSRMLLLADSHFHYREPRTYREKAADPYSYPNSVNPLRYLPYAHIIENGGFMRTLFGTGIVHVRNPELLPAVSRPWDLADPAKAGRYTHLIATGQPENLSDIMQKTQELFAATHRDEHLLVLERKTDEP